MRTRPGAAGALSGLLPDESAILADVGEPNRQERVERDRGIDGDVEEAAGDSPARVLDDDEVALADEARGLFEPQTRSELLGAG